MSRARWLAGVVGLAVLTACPPPASPVVMPSDNLGDTTVGVAYSHTITATGGTGALTYSATGLPAGLSMSGSGTISGSATAAGDFTVQVTATDTKGVSATQGYPLKVYAAPTVTATVPSTANVGTAFSGLLQSTGGKAPVAFGVASGQLPPGITINATSGLVSGTPTFAGTFTATVSATDANGASATTAITIAVYASAPPSVVTTSLPNGVVGASYLHTLIAQDGQPPYTWAVSSGGLPNGLSLSASGQISGSPTEAGNSTFQVSVTDANNQVARANLSLAVHTSLQITTTALPEGYATIAYAATTLGATGGQSPYTWTLSSALPTGLSFNATSATLSGTPAAGSAGSYGLTFTVADGSGQTRSASFTLDIYALPQVTTTSLADGAVGVSYSQALQASGGKAPLTWAITTGTLPAGILLDGPSGTLLGTPTASGSSTFNVQVTDANGRTATRVLTLSVFTGLTVTYGPAPDGYTGQAYSETLTAAGGRTPYTWSLAAGSLPAGLSIAAAGTLSGAPSSTGTFNFTLRVTDANSQTATRALTITVYDPPQLTTASIPDGYQGQVYPSLTLQGTGGKAPHSFSVSAGALPSGLSLSAAGVLSGTPTALASSAITVTLADANGRTASRNYTFGVYPVPAISTTTLSDGYAGSAYSATLSTGGTGKSPISWAITGGALPAGLSLDSATGVISGTPTAAGTASFSIQARDANNQASASVSLSLAIYAPLSITSPTLTDGYTGTAYTGQITAAGGKTPYTFSVVAGALPAGLSLNASTGALSGTPTTAGASTFTAQVADANGRTASAAIVIAVYAPPSVSTTALADAYAVTAYSATVAGTGGKTPYSFSITAGALPAGLTLSTTGAISGTPSGAPGTFTFTVTMADANGITASRPLTIEVLDTLQVTTAALADGYTGSAYSRTLAASGGRPPHRWSSGALPAGLSLNTTTGAITGTPSSASTTTVTFTVTDANNATASRSLAIAIYAPPSVAPGVLPDAYPSISYSGTVTGTGGKTPYSFAAGSGLPAGLVMLPSGVINGSTTASPGSSTFTVTMTDANGISATQTFSITVRADLAISPATLADAYVTEAYPGGVTGSGGRTPYTWSIASGALPAGLSLDPSSGSITGTPTAAGSASFTVRLTDANSVSATRAYVIQTYALPSITTTALANAVTNAAYNQPIASTGGKSPFTWTQTGTLPTGITFNTGTATFGGTAPATTGSFPNIVVTLTDANGRSTSRTYTLVVATSLTITTASVNDAYVGTGFSQTLAASGGTGTGYSFAVTSGALPAGLSLSSAGVISGTPSGAPMTASFTVTVTDSGGNTGTRTFTQNVYGALTITTASLADGYTGQSYSQTLAGAGGRAPYNWSIISGAPPVGISFAGGGAGNFNGTPTGTGTATFTVQLADANGVTVSRSLSISVYAQPAITTTSYPDGYAGESYSASTTGTGGKAPLTWSVSAGALPAGLNLNASTGAISGSPAGGGTQTFTITLSDANGVTASRSLSITVYNQPMITSPPLLADGYVAQPYSFTFTATGGKAPLTWSLTGGSPPAGLTLSAAGTLGTAIAAGAATGPTSFTVSVTDANGRAVSAPFTMTVYRVPSITTMSLTAATEGVTYLRAPGTPESLTGTDGKAPLSFSAGAGLPGGIVLSSSGVFSGIPAQGTAGPHPVTFTVTDLNGRTGTATLNLQVNPARPIYGGGTHATAPSGSPITDTLTVFTQDYGGHPYPNMAVRLRKNGVEFSPVKQQVTDSAGKTVFTGLGLNGTTDTVDVTVNGAHVVNESWQKINASLVTIPLIDYPLPIPRAYASGGIDPPSGKLLITGGMNPAFGGTPFINGMFTQCQNDVVRLTDSAAGSWVEDMVPGITNAPLPRYGSAMAYSASSAAHVLFGGVDCNTSGMLNDVWHYNAATATWAQRSPTGAIPSPRHQAAMAGLSSGQIVLFSGSLDPFSPFPISDLYVYDPATSNWSPRSPTPMPPARANAGATAVGNTLWVCGGNDGATDLSDCWSYDPSSNVWSPRSSLPSPRQGHAMATATGGQVYVFGGQSMGVDLNELLVSNGGGWTVPPQTNPPPPREGAVLAFESATGRLLLFGGRNAFGQYYNDVWSYSPATGAWTQRTQTYANPAPSGFTISGTISNGALGNRSRVTIEASGLSGYTNRQILILTNGSATYTMDEIPPGDTISLTALNEDLNRTPYPNREWSWLDLGVVATNISGNVTQNVVLPTGPLTSQLLTSTGSYTLPSGYLSSAFQAVLTRMTRPGYANHPNGFYQVNAATRTFRADYFPPSAGTGQTLIPEVGSGIAQACEQSFVWLYNVTPGTLPEINFPPGPRSLTPGLNGCIPAGTGLLNMAISQGSQPATMSSGGIAVGDLSGDGITDLVMVSGDSVDIFYGQGSGEGWYPFFPTLSIPLAGGGSSGNGVGLADFDRNGRLDIAVGIAALAQVAVLLQSAPGGSFSTVLYPSFGPVSGSLVVGDVTGDTFADIIHSGGPQISWLTGRGDGTFNPPNGLGTSTLVTALSPPADLDGDGIRDIAYGQNFGQINFLRGMPGGLQPSPFIQPTPGVPGSIATGDLDGDGLQDLAVGMQSPPMLQTLRRTGAFSFNTATQWPLPSTPNQVAIAELTGDTLRDVVVAQQDWQLVEFNGTGGGGVLPFFTTFTSLPPVYLAIGDINTDGNMDVLAGEQIGGQQPWIEMFAARRPIPTGTDALSFVAPPNTRVYSVTRGPANIAYDYEVYSRGAAGTNTVDFPLLSTLRPSRPAPAGQTVMWAPLTYQANDPANLNMDNFKNFRLRMDAQGSVWANWLYRR